MPAASVGKKIRVVNLTPYQFFRNLSITETGGIMIQEYRFGKMVIDGATYDQDLIIAGSEVLPNWWREKGHNLVVKDIEKVIDTHKPDILVVGKGQFGMMSISDEVYQYLHDQGIELIHKKTGKAVQIFNKYYSQEKNVIGAFHLTC